jgi:hypothetical protein
MDDLARGYLLVRCELIRALFLVVVAESTVADHQKRASGNPPLRWSAFSSLPARLPSSLYSCTLGSPGVEPARTAVANPDGTLIGGVPLLAEAPIAT